MSYANLSCKNIWSRDEVDEISAYHTSHLLMKCQDDNFKPTSLLMLLLLNLPQTLEDDLGSARRRTS